MSACSYMEHDGGGGSDGFGCSIVILHGPTISASLLYAYQYYTADKM